MVKIYDKHGKFGGRVKVKAKKGNIELNDILQYFNDTLKNYPEDQQQFILNNFDTTNGFNTLKDLFVEFCLARVQEFEKGLCMNSCFSEKNKDKLVKRFVMDIGRDFYHTQTYLDEKDKDSFLYKYCKDMICYDFY